MTDQQHYFAAQGLLPAWREAFSHVSDIAPLYPSVVWVRLAAGEKVAVRLAQLHAAYPGVPIVVMSDTPNDDEGVAAFAAAARGYCNSHASAPVLRQIADVVLQGGVWVGESLMQRLLTGVAHRPAPAVASQDWVEKLTAREQQVARAVAAGKSNKQIARELEITERTVKAHVSAVLEKLGVSDRLQLALLVSAG